MLAASPATAHHIAFELAQYFVADNPPQALVDRLTQGFHATGGDIAAVLKTLLTSREFRDSTGQKYKTPYQYVDFGGACCGPGRGQQPAAADRHAWPRLGEPLYYRQTLLWL